MKNITKVNKIEFYFKKEGFIIGEVTTFGDIKWFYKLHSIRKDEVYYFEWLSFQDSTGAATTSHTDLEKSFSDMKTWPYDCEVKIFYFKDIFSFAEYLKPFSKTSTHIPKEEDKRNLIL